MVSVVEEARAPGAGEREACYTRAHADPHDPGLALIQGIDLRFHLESLSL